MHTIKITPNILFEYQCTSGKFIRLPNRIESKKIDSVARIESNRNIFCPNWNALDDGRRWSDPESLILICFHFHRRITGLQDVRDNFVSTEHAVSIPAVQWKFKICASKHVTYVMLSSKNRPQVTWRFNDVRTQWRHGVTDDLSVAREFSLISDV